MGGRLWKTIYIYWFFFFTLAPVVSNSHATRLRLSRCVSIDSFPTIFVLVICLYKSDNMLDVLFCSCMDFHWSHTFLTIWVSSTSEMVRFLGDKDMAMPPHHSLNILACPPHRSHSFPFLQWLPTGSYPSAWSSSSPSYSRYLSVSHIYGFLCHACLLSFLCPSTLFLICLSFT